MLKIAVSSNIACVTAEVGGIDKGIMILSSGHALLPFEVL